MANAPHDPKVSVVVPVWNPGRYLERCVDSLLAQSIPPHWLELIFVDDGSTDGAAERLDEIAAQHDHVRVIHEPGSGWAGRPRNVGIDAARGRWVQFVDQDDTMAPDALRRLADLGDRGDTEIVIGKVTTDFRPVDHDVFSQTRHDATLLNAPLIQSLTPHKMFRRTFLLDEKLRFAEGPRRLEDQLFMVQAYLRARFVGILADYNCYFYLRRDDGGNSGSARFDPSGYYGDLREVLDAVEERTDPGPLRDLMLARFLHSEVLQRVTGPKTLKRTEKVQQRFVTVTRGLVVDRFPPALRDSMPSTDRLALDLLVAGDADGLRSLATCTAGVRVNAQVRSARWVDDAWELGISAALRHADGSPVELVPAGTSWTLDPRLQPATRGGSQTMVDVAADIEKATAAVFLVERSSRLTWPTSGEWHQELRPAANGTTAHLVFNGTVRVGVEDGARSPLDPGTWDVVVRLRAFGLTRMTAVRMTDAVRQYGDLSPALVGPGPTAVIPYTDTERNSLVLDVGETTRSMLIEGFRHGQGKNDFRDGVLRLPMAGLSSSTTPPQSVPLLLEQSGQTAIPVAASLVPHNGSVVLTVPLDPDALSAGIWRLRAPDHCPLPALALVKVGRNGSMRVRAPRSWIRPER